MDDARRACSFFLARLRSEVERLSGTVYPGHHPGPHKWLHLVAGLIDTAENYLIQAQMPGIDPTRSSVLVADAEDLGDEAYELLEHMAGADASHIPHQVVAPFQRWVDGLGIKNTIFFRAEHAANYELWIVDYDVQSLNAPSPKLLSAANSIKWPLLRVTVPSQALGLLPHFAVVGHELGHAVEDRIKIDLSAYDPEWQGVLTRMDQRLSGLDNDDILAAKAILSDWVIELKSDAIGFLIAGPAFFFALCGFLELAGSGYGIGLSHPPSDMRRNLLIDNLSLESPSFLEIFADRLGLTITADINSPHIEKLPPPDTLFSELSLKLGKRDAAICVELLPFVSGMAGDIYTSARRYLRARKARTMIYKPGQFALHLQRHLDPLCALIPPIEYEDGGTMRATSLASILNVGWAALLTRLESIPLPRDALGDPSAGRMERLHELLLKAVELSEARRLWDEHQ